MKKFLSVAVIAVMLVASIFTAGFSASAAKADSGLSQSAVKISSEPKSAAVRNGKTVKVTVKAKGKNLKYVWYYKKAGSSSFKKTDYFKGNTYSLKMNEERNGRQVYCVVTDKSGKSVRTDTVTLKLKNDFKISLETKDAAAYDGKTAKVTVKAEGDGLKYVWYYKNPGASSFKKSDSVKGDTYTLKMSKKKSGRQVYCVVTDKNGKKAISDTVTLELRTKLKVKLDTKSASVYSGKTAKVTVKAEGDGLKYVWYYKNPGSSSFKKTDSFKGKTYSLKMTSKKNGRQIYCKVTDKYGKTKNTDVVTLEMRTALSISTQPESAAAYNGKAAKVTFKAKGDGLKYQWYYKDPGSSSFKKTSTFKSNSYSLEMSSKKNGRQVYCKVTDKYGKSVKTETVTLYLKKAAAKITCKDCLAKKNGTTFNTSRVYTQTNVPAQMPLTFETVFSISKKDINTKAMRPLDRYNKYTETVIFSNDNTFDAAICISVTEDGHPKLGLRQKNWYCRFNNILFDKVNVFSDKPVHMSIVINHAEKAAKCYINGKLMQTVKDIPKAVRKAFVPEFSYAVGGDLYNGNPNYFRGRLYSLSIWSDIRTDSEIASDYYAGINTADSKLMASYNLSLCDKCMLKDSSSNKNNLVAEKLWLTKDEVAPVGDYDYSFAVIGDTQELSEDDPTTFTALYEWIVDNKEAQKIEYVVGLGDITQKSYAHEWEHARNQIYKMNGVVPYLLTRGNHDYNTVVNGVITAGFNKTFDDGIYNQQLTGVMTEGDLSNAYRVINICGIDYLFLTLDFGPDIETLRWASSVVEAYPEHRVIVATHGYMYRDGTTLDATDAYPASTHPLRDKKAQQAEKPSLDGDEMWKEFAKKHKNIQLVLSGHDPCQHIVYRQDKGDNGNVVTQMLVDPQHIDSHNGPTSLVAMFYFSDNGNKLTVRYYSVVKDMYGSESSQFTIDLD